MKREDFEKSVRETIADVTKEFSDASEKWGIQNHDTRVNLMILLEEVGEVCEAEDEIKDKAKDAAIDDLYSELIQVAAMAIMVADSLKRNGYKPMSEEAPNLALYAGCHAGKKARNYLEGHYYAQGLHKVNSEPLELEQRSL